MDLLNFFTTLSLIIFLIQNQWMKNLTDLSCIVVHRSISSSCHEFMQAKLEKCSGLYESHFNPFWSPQSVFRCACHWIFKSLGWIPQPEFEKNLFPIKGLEQAVWFCKRVLIIKIFRKSIVGVTRCLNWIIFSVQHHYEHWEHWDPKCP